MAIVVNIADKMLKSKDKRVRRMAEQILDLIRSKEVEELLEIFRKMIGQFHNYSFNNILLIHIQKPDAVLVAGMRKWNKLGRYVRKGEKGIMIFAPKKKILHKEYYAVKVVIEGEEVIDREIMAYISNEMDDDYKKAVLDELLRRGREKYGDEAEISLEKVDEIDIPILKGFIPVYVFDYYQTEECEKWMKCYKEKPFRIEEFKAIYRAGYKDDEFWDLIYKASLQFVSNIRLEPLSRLETWGGYYRPSTDEIVINSYMKSFDRAEVLLHEISHYIVHKKLKLKLDYNFEEIVVELASLMVVWLYLEASEKRIDIKHKAVYIKSYMEKGRIDEKGLMNALNVANKVFDMIMTAIEQVRAE